MNSIGTDLYRSNFKAFYPLCPTNPKIYYLVFNWSMLRISIHVSTLCIRKSDQ